MSQEIFIFGRNNQRKLEEKVVISFKNVYQQKFDFPYDVMKHILGNASYNVVKKLYYICKYFPQKLQFYLIDSADYGSINFLNDSFSSCDPSDLNVNYSIPDKIWIDDRICQSFFYSLKWIPKIGKCTIKRLEIIHHDLQWNDFKMLAKGGTIEDLDVVKVVNSDGTQVPVEDICALIPNINSFGLSNTHVTPRSVKDICKSLKSTTLHRFSKRNIDGPLNADDYLELLQKYQGVKESLLVLEFISIVPNRQEFFAKVKSEIEKMPEPKPMFFAC